MKYAVIIWVLLTLLICYQMAYNGTYQSDDPFAGFVRRLPLTALICGAIVFGIYGVTRALRKNGNK